MRDRTARRQSAAWVACLALGLGCSRAESNKPPPSQTIETGQSTETTTLATPRAVILMIGDGMGPEAVKAAAWYTHGAETGLTMQTLPVQGLVRTANLDGIGDSASCGTALAAGHHTWNGAVGMNRFFEPVENVLELAAANDWSTGVVTTSELSHATPAVFTAHHANRSDQAAIASLQLDSPVDLLLGGGWAFVYGQSHADSQRSDDGLLDQMATRGITWVDSTQTLADATELPIHGAFFATHLPYDVLRDGTEDIPSLAALTTVALGHLQDNPEGFFLMVEGARIDHAGHGNRLDLQVGEVTTFDEAVQAVMDWSVDQPHEVTLIVTADHETGGLQVLNGAPAGVLPEVSWRWRNHTNTDVPVYAMGPGTQVLDQQLVDQTWVHAVLQSRITDTPMVVPSQVLLPDGRFDDLDHRITTQVNPSSIGDGVGRLEAMELNADDHALSIGLEGIFPFYTHSVTLVIDVDFGASTGPQSLAGAASDVDTPLDLYVSSLPLLAPSVPGFGADLVAVSIGGTETPYLPFFRGVRGLHANWGTPSQLGPIVGGLNYGLQVRSNGTNSFSLVPGEGYEVTIPWNTIWPDLQSGVPPGTVIAVAAVLTSLDGTALTNQALPPFPSGTLAPGTIHTPIPGLVVFPVDEDGDGIASGSTAPYMLP